MAWLQLVHRVGLNSLIVAHHSAGADEIKDMFDRMIGSYPVAMLYEIGEAYADDEKKLEHVGKSGNIQRVIQRNCKIKIGTIGTPDSCRGGDYNLVHLSEVGLWKTTDGKKPEDIVRSACSGVLLQPYTMIVYESTANGVGNFFHREYLAAKRGESQFSALFIPWYDIEQYSLPFKDEKERLDFEKRLLLGKDDDSIHSRRQQTGKYLYGLYQAGATLEALHWYVRERAKFNDNAEMAAEYPSDDDEAFANSGERVFDHYQVELLRKSCRSAKYIGELRGKGEEGKDALEDLCFSSSGGGSLSIWNKPDVYENEDDFILDRYLVAVDIGGKSKKSDYSVIVVLDRLGMMGDDVPVVVAQWYGHAPHHVIAWKAAQIASYYHNALLVIESNTLETKDPNRDVDGDMSGYILALIRDAYDNLYARSQSEEQIRQSTPKKYGFHTNTHTKPKIIANLSKCVEQGLWVERDECAIDELITYEKKPNGSMGAIIGHHDDLLMARAIGLYVCYQEMDSPRLRKSRSSTARRRVGLEATIG